MKKTKKFNQSNKIFLKNLNKIINLLVVIVFLNNFNLVLGKNYYAEERDLFPCSFFDTINITGGVLDPRDDSITFNGVRYSMNHYQFYDYDFRERDEKIKVKKHLRGCVCTYKTCIRLCCPKGYIYHEAETSLNNCKPDPKFTNFYINITNDDGNITTHDVFNDNKYDAVFTKPCSGWFLTPELYEEDFWKLLPNGELFQNDTGDDGKFEYLKRDAYCVANVLHNDNDKQPFYRALTCHNMYAVQTAVYPIGMLISVPFLIVTFAVYAWIRELRAKLHGKSLMCYVLTLACAYSVLASVQLNGHTKLHHALCVALGYLIQTSFMASFLWLNVICFDIWATFGKGGERVGKRFLKYSIYAWGMTLVFIFFNYLMDNVDGIPDDFRPGFGKQNCWLQRRESELFYLFLPVFIIITINIMLFTLTAHKIRKAQKDSAKVLTRGDSRITKIQTDKEKFGLFFRLFIIMGVTWSMEIISWLIDPQSWIFYIPDICNCAQGVVIFVLFVCNRRVRNLISKRYNKMRGIMPDQSMYTSRTSTSHISMREHERSTMIKSEKNSIQN